MKSYTAIAKQYAEAVVRGDIAGSKWVRLACQRQLDDLKRFKGKDSPYRFNPILTDKTGRKFRPADNLCAFVERLPHVKGPLAGQAIELAQWQIFILTTIYGWVKPDGHRRFRRAYIEVPRGNGNTMAFPKDETTPWGTNGIRAYWQGEAAPSVTTKPVLGLSTLRLKKLMALVPTTDELLEDANALSTYLPEKIALSIRWKTNESILFGSGSGVPVGALNAGATVTVAKETGQSTQTLLAQNLAKMIARLPTGSFANAVWIVNNDVLPALFTLTLGNYQRLLLVVQGLKKLFADENFVTLLRAEGLDTLPKYLAERISNFSPKPTNATNPTNPITSNEITTPRQLEGALS